jgi:hypothetical protein
LTTLKHKHDAVTFSTPHVTDCPQQRIIITSAEHNYHSDSFWMNWMNFSVV